MKKNLSKVLVLFSMLLATGNFLWAASKKVETQIVSIDKHGNANLAIQSSLLGVKGIGASDIVNVKVGNYKFSAPVVKDYSDVDSGNFLMRVNGDEVSLALNLANFAEKTGAKVGNKVTITVKEKYGYLETYQIRLLKKSEDRDKFESDEVFANFREVTLGNIASKRLYRCTNPVSLDARAPYAAKFLEENNVSLVINLGDTEEAYIERGEPSPYYKKLYEDGKVLFLNTGAAFTSDAFTVKIKEAFQFIANHPGEVYCIHGKEGKNRTGYMIAIIAALSGASLEDINADYMKSYENYFGVKKGRQQYDEIAKTIPYFFSVMNGGKVPSAKKLQSVAEKYLKTTIGLSQDEINTVLKNLQE